MSKKKNETKQNKTRQNKTKNKTKHNKTKQNKTKHKTKQNKTPGIPAPFIGEIAFTIEKSCYSRWSRVKKV